MTPLRRSPVEPSIRIRPSARRRRAELLLAYQAEHAALHGYFMAHLNGSEAQERHRRYELLIDAHDAVVELLENEPL